MKLGWMKVNDEELEVLKYFWHFPGPVSHVEMCKYMFRNHLEEWEKTQRLLDKLVKKRLVEVVKKNGTDLYVSITNETEIMYYMGQYARKYYFTSLSLGLDDDKIDERFPKLACGSLDVPEGAYQILEYLWQHEKAGLEEILIYFSKPKHIYWKRQVFENYIERIAEKKYINIEERENSALYSAAISKEELMEKFADSDYRGRFSRVLYKILKYLFSKKIVKHLFYITDDRLCNMEGSEENEKK